MDKARVRTLTKSEIDAILAQNPQPKHGFRMKKRVKIWVKWVIWQLAVLGRAIVVVGWRKPRRAYFSWRARNGIRALSDLDGVMVRAGWNRVQRRRFWREFIKNAQTRQACLDRMSGELDKP